MQRRIAIWILGTFWTSPSLDIKVIVDFIPIYLHLWKLSGRAQLRAHHALPHNYIIQSLLESRLSIHSISYQLSLDSLTPYQRKLIKDPIIDMDNRFNKVFSSFDPHNQEFSPGSRIIDTFSSWFSFHSFNKHSKNNLTLQSYQLDDLLIVASLDPSYALVITDTSIKNNVATSITHIYIYNKPVIKTLHHVVNITTTEAELFTIRCGINQATNIKDFSKIVIITNLLNTAQRIFNLLSHPFQIYSAAILNKLKKFFLQHQNNSIKFWECPSQCNWLLHKVVNKESKQFHLISCYLCKLSWNFSKKSKCNDILSSWKITFQASDLKEHQFLNLCDGDNNLLELLYTNSST